MTYQTISDYNVSSPEQILSYVATTVDIFIPMMLFSLFIITLLGTYFAQQRIQGRGKFASSFAVAGYFTLIIAFFLSLIPNVINTLELVVTFIVAIVGTAMLLFSEDR